MRSPRVALTALLSVVLLAAGASGCAADTASDAPIDDNAGVDELNASSLRGATALKGSVVAGTEITLHYDRSDARYPRAIPYLAVEIVAAPTTHTAGLHPMSGETDALQQIDVRGSFPGSPKVLVVDESFSVIAQAVAKTQPDGSELAVVDAPRKVGKRFVLTRDGRWSRPMDFQVRVGQ